MGRNFKIPRLDVNFKFLQKCLSPAENDFPELDVILKYQDYLFSLTPITAQEFTLLLLLCRPDHMANS
jgi:hypothetical protein